LLAYAGGLRLPEGIILGEEAHREFMVQSGFSKDLRACTPGGGEDAASRALGMRVVHRQSLIEGELNRQICGALVDLGAPSVAVVSEGLINRHLKSIPKVKDAITEAWLSPEGLRRQIEAASRGEEIPTWPVLILAENAP
jgi:hypothetical protein